MKRFLTTAVVALLGFGPGVPAEAAQPVAHGQLCSITRTNAGQTATAVRGGPVAVADVADVTANPATVTLTCTIKLGVANNTHAAPGVYSASGSGLGVASLPEQAVNFSAAAGERVVVCSQLTVVDANGATHVLYWDDTAAFQTSASTSCDTGVCQTSLPGETCSGGSTLPPDQLLLRILPGLVGYAFEAVVDPALCGVLADLAPGIAGVVDIEPDGDVYVLGEWFWDCPPYGTA